MVCDKCYEDYISCGNETILVAATLTAFTAYKYLLTTPQGAIYSGDVTTDGNGNFSIDVSTLPNGILNPYAGKFILTVTADDAYQCGTEIWNDSAYCDSFSCISFEVKNGDFIKNTLGCPCELL